MLTAPVYCSPEEALKLKRPRGVLETLKFYLWSENVPTILMWSVVICSASFITLTISLRGFFFYVCEKCPPVPVIVPPPCPKLECPECGQLPCTVQEECPPGWLYQNGLCGYVSPDERTYRDAEIACTENGAILSNTNTIHVFVPNRYAGIYIWSKPRSLNRLETSKYCQLGRVNFPVERTEVPCDEFHPFICVKSPRLPSKCPNGWRIDVATNRCYFISLTAVSQRKAVDTCSSLNAQLTHPGDEHVHEFCGDRKEAVWTSTCRKQNTNHTEWYTADGIILRGPPVNFEDVAFGNTSCLVYNCLSKRYETSTNQHYYLCFKIMG
ncbi:C-type lectin protein [Ranid herpesvirus 3]|uniref:C-type lectin protein n=1 Tax=Ranid herpesvirus 3 TaxID=1987509 RepID=A0A1X9T5H5_9VIRU|nr:C-type lectin protein [Ranid herpesvirus 3]ARR28951.1 C-type lectin protein [Ranid herpesvirus 3]